MTPAGLVERPVGFFVFTQRICQYGDMHRLLLVGLGGAVGAVLRYLVSGLAYRWLGESFPWGTLAVNLLGCFVIGLLWPLVEQARFPAALSPFVFMGIIGAFTTFSTYGLESLNLIRDGQVVLGLINILVSNLLGLALVLLGFVLARALLAPPG